MRTPELSFVRVKDGDWKLFSKAAKANKQIGGEVNMRVTKNLLLGDDQIVGARFSKNKRFDRSHMTIGRPIP